MNIPNRLPPIQTKNGIRIPSARQKTLNMENGIMKIIPKPLSRQSVQLNDSENEQNVPKRPRKISIDKSIDKSIRCRSSKNISRSYSTQKSIQKLPKNMISGKNIANLPYITAKSWALYQINTNKLIYGKRQSIRRQVASLTKIANLITILQILNQNNLDEERIMVTVTKQAARMIGTTATIKQGMIFSLKDLFYGMMLPSGNDAAYQIAQVGGTIINLLRDNQKLQQVVYDKDILASSIQRFNNNILVYLNKVNTIARFKAKTTVTSFANPHGLSNVNSLSTAQDMAKLSAYGMKNDKFREVVQTKEFTTKYKISQDNMVNDENIDPNVSPSDQKCQFIEKTITWQNTNKMLWRGFSGLKTGITPNAGPCLSATVKKNINGKQYEFVMILLKSISMEARWKQVEGLAQWVQGVIIQ